MCRYASGLQSAAAKKMADIILERTGMSGADAFHTVHNYINTDEMILRKGAIAAHKDELVLIPINMRDGSVLARKGQPGLELFCASRSRPDHVPVSGKEHP